MTGGDVTGRYTFYRGQFMATAQKLARERTLATQLVPKLLRDTSLQDLPLLAEHIDLQNCGAIELLGAVATAALTSDPKYSLALTQIAVGIAEKHQVGEEYPALITAQMRGHAWKEHATALRFLSRYTESLEALDHAEASVQPFAVLEYERAQFSFDRGVVLQEIERYDEALALLNHCQEVFREHGDTDRLVLCSLAEGVLFQRLRKYREAREIYLLLLASTNGIDPIHLAALHLAIGVCSIDLEDFAEADLNLEKSITLHRNLGQPIQALKGELGRGRLLLRKGQFGQAVNYLRPVRRNFLRHGLSEEAGLCGLEIAEGLLALNRYPEAENLARKIVHEFVIAKLNTRAVKALTYLAEAITSNQASSRIAREIHEYVLSLRNDPEREFAHQTFTV